MGRWSTGAFTTGQCLQLNIKAFSKYLKEKIEYKGSIHWSNGASITFEIYPNDFSSTVILCYSKKDRDGKTNQIRYSVKVISTPSNLGKGCIYYFVCPYGSKRCKILYLGYGSYYFKCREAYTHRIYYASQLSSRMDYHNDKYWNYERKLGKQFKKRYRRHYKGKETPIQKRIAMMMTKRDYHDEMRWNVFPKSLMKSMGLFR